MSLVFINHPQETFTPTKSGALATVIWECCRVARQESLNPIVITRRSDEALFDWPNTVEIEYPNLPTQAFPVKVLRAQRKLSGWRHLRHKNYAERVAKIIREKKLETLPFVLFNDPEMVIFLRQRFPKAHIVHRFDNHLEAEPRVQKNFAKAATSILGVSDFTSRWVSRYYNAPKVETLYNGVDLQHFCPAETCSETVPFINFVGRTGIEKAPDLLLKAALQLSTRTREFGVQIIGSNHWERFELDDYQREMQNLVTQIEAAGIEVRRLGHVGRHDLPTAIRQAQIHVVPSRWDEPFGLTTVEGMACGLAIVASNTGGTPEIIGDSGFLFTRDSVNELAAHLEKLVTDEKLRIEYSKLARQKAEEFSWQSTWRGLKTAAGI